VPIYWFTCSLFWRLFFSNWDYIESSERMVSERWTIKDLEGSGCDLMLSHYPSIYLGDWGKPRRASVRISDLRIDWASIWMHICVCVFCYFIRTYLCTLCRMLKIYFINSYKYEKTSFIPLTHFKYIITYWWIEVCNFDIYHHHILILLNLHTFYYMHISYYAFHVSLLLPSLAISFPFCVLLP
jgi:hypothetical protein